MLHRVIYASRAVGATGSTLSIAQILGASDANNRRRGVTGCVMFHQGHIMQMLEGHRSDLNGLMSRLREDPRHTDIRVLVDMPIVARAFSQPMGVCGDPALLLRKIGQPCLSTLTANDARAMVEAAQAA